MFEGIDSVSDEYPLTIMMETVDFAVADKSQLVRQYFPTANEKGFYENCWLMLRYAGEGNCHIWYDLRRPESVANLGFFQNPAFDAGYEFEFDDRFVLSIREDYQGKYVDSRRIVFGYDGEIRLHRQYFERYSSAGPIGEKIIDRSNEGVNKILVKLLNNCEDVWPDDLLASDEPGVREFGLDVYFRSCLPTN